MNLLKILLIIIICASIASLLKSLLFPFLSVGYGVIRSNRMSLSDKIGGTIAMALYEIFLLGVYYIVALVMLILISNIFFKKNITSIKSIIIGSLCGSIVYALYQLEFYTRGARIYTNHSKFPNPKNYWYGWIELPKDAELLFIYFIVSAFGGWLYYKWISAPEEIEIN